ncbi:MAG: Ig-like domain repeat protein [Lachnospiraceae bacterium]|nr:Ig-like domain repeat protein [Lachnospiraceae bacterium]
MRKMIQRGIVVLFSMIMGGLPVLTEAVYAFERQDDKWRRPRTKAEENMTVCEDEDNTGTTGPVKNEIPEEGILPVKIIRDDGIEIIPRDKEVININSTVLFSADMGVREDLFFYKKETGMEYDDVEGLLSEKTELQYSVSYDKGATFGDWMSSDHGKVYISPVTYRDGEYCIRFRKLQEYVINENRAETMRIAEKVAADNKKNKEPEEEYKEEKRSEDPAAEDTEPGETNTEDEKSADEKTEENKTEDAKPRDEKAEDTKAEDVKPVEEKGEDTETEDAKPGEGKAEDTKAEDVKPVEEKGEDTETENAKPGEGKAEDTKTGDDKTGVKEAEPAGGDIKDVKEEPDHRETEDVSSPTAEDKIHRAEEIAAGEGVHVIGSGLYFVNMDTAAPVLMIDSEAEEGEWKNKGVKCIVRINDTDSLPAWLRITYDDNSIAEESFSYDTGLSGTQKEFVINAESASEKGGELVVEAADRAGNRTRISRRIGIDRTAPEISLRGAEEGKIYGKPVSVSVTGEDMFPDSVCVGYTVKRIICGTEETVVRSAKTLSECNEGTLFTTDTDGDYLVECHASDRAGNESRVIKRGFRVDSTPPGLKLEGINEGTCLRGDAALKITACDNYEDGYSVSLKGTVKSADTRRDLKLADYKTEGLISSNTYFFKADGDYEISVEVKDAAGNTSSEGISFSIDRTAPEIRLSDNISTSEELVTNEPPVIRFGVKESNYKSTLVSYELRTASGDEKKKDCKASEWFMSSPSDEFSVQVEEEGSYELVVNAVDGAGNSSCKTVRFTLDMTSPQIDYVENLNKKYIKKFKLPDNFNEYIKDQGEVSYQTYINSRNYDEAEQIEEDGKYVLKVSAVDDAGNQTEKTVEFIVDGTLPRVIIDGMSDDGSVNKDGTIVLSLYDEGDYFKSVRLNGEEMVSGEGQETVEINIPGYGDYRIDVEAVDMADNILTQTIEARCANASPVEKGVTTVRTLKQTEKGSNKGLRIFLIIMTVAVLGGSIVVFTYYNIKTCGNDRDS